MIIRSIKSQAAESVVMSFIGPGPKGRIDIVETSKTTTIVDNFTEPSQLLARLDELAEATRLHVAATMSAKRGDGAVFINCMEKLTMNNPAMTLKARLGAAMDAGIEGITLSAGLHLGTFALIEQHPRFRDVNLGVIVSSLRAFTTSPKSPRKRSIASRSGAPKRTKATSLTLIIRPPARR